MPDLIDTNDANENDSSIRTSDENTASLMDDFFADADVHVNQPANKDDLFADVQTNQPGNNDDPFADVSFHGQNNKEDESGDIFSGMATVDKTAAVLAQTTSSGSGPELFDIFGSDHMVMAMKYVANGGISGAVLTANFTWNDLKSPHVSPSIQPTVHNDYRTKAVKIRPEKTKHKSQKKKGTRNKTSIKHRSNYNKACERLLSIIVDKNRKIKAAIPVLKKSGPELPNLLTQFSASIPGTGIAILFLVMFKVASGRVPFCSSKLLNTGLGLGLVWLSWAVNRLRDTIVMIKKNSSIMAMSFLWAYIWIVMHRGFKPVALGSYKVEVMSYRDDDEEAFLRFWVKDNISQTGNKTTVNGQHGGVSSEDLYELYQEAIDFKNHLALHKNDNMRFNILVTSVEDVIHTIASYQEEIQVDLDLPSTSLTNEIMPFSERSKFFYGPISVELLVLKFIQVPEVKIHIQSDDDEFKTVNGRETAKPHLNNPGCSKIGRLKRVTPDDLVYPPVMTRSDLNRYFSVWPIWTPYLLKLTPTTEKEKKTWQKFEQETLETEVTPGTLIDEEKRSIALDHPIVSDIGNFAVFTYNKACNMHVKMVEHNLHDIEFMECKYKKVGRIYHFYLTIEAIEEGNLGIYEAEVLCESVAYWRSLCKFNLTNRKPFGMKAMAVSYLSCLRSACKTLDDLFNERMTRLNFLCESLAGGESWAVFGEMERLRELHLETLKGLRKKLYQDAHSLFPSDCDRTTNPGDWHDPSDVPSSGMVPRAKDSTCSGYDYYPYGWISFMPVVVAGGWVFE
ncbi:hypothetical protein Tco_0688468 [Tanacetum coccineum]